MIEKGACFLKNEKKKDFSIIMDFVMITIGAVIAAFAIEEFLVPCTILDGGVIGIGIMVNNLSGISLSILTIGFNIPFLIETPGKSIFYKIRIFYDHIFCFSGDLQTIAAVYG